MAIARSVTWIGVSQISSVVLQFAASVVLARILSPHDMGVFAIAGATVGVLSILQAFGLQSLIIREEVLTEDIAATAFTLNAVIAVVLAAVVAGLSYAGGRFLHDEGVRKVMLALSITPLIGAFDFLPSSRLEREARFKALSLAGIISGAASALTSIVMAMLGARYMSAAYAGWASAGVYAVILNVVGREHVSFRLAVSQWRRVATYGLQMLAVSGLRSLGWRISDIALGKFQGLSVLGIYSRSGTLNALVWTNIHNAASKVMLVDFATLNRRGTSLRERYIVTVDVMTTILWPAFAGLAVVAGPFIANIYGHRWAPAALPLALLCTASIISVSSAMVWEIFAATGNLAAQSRSEVLNVSFGTLAFIGGSMIGLIPAAASRVVSATFSAFIYRPQLNRMTQTSLKDLWPIYWRNAGLTALAIGPAAVLMLAHRMSENTPLWQVLIAIVAGMALWLAGLAATRHILFLQGVGFLHARRRTAPVLAGEVEIAAMRPYEVVGSQSEF